MQIPGAHPQESGCVNGGMPRNLHFKISQMISIHNKVAAKSILLKSYEQYSLNLFPLRLMWFLAISQLSRNDCCPGWRGSVDRALVCELKDRRLNSQSGHMPGVWARSPAGGVQEANNPCISRTLMFLFPSFSLSLKANT